MPVINQAYYQQTGQALQAAAVGDFSAVVAGHKANMLATTFDKPSEEVFKENLKWIAEQVVSQPGSRSYKDADDITDDDLRKLEILKAEYGFDYLQEIRLGFTMTQDNTRCEYTKPLLMHLAGMKGDFTDYQTGIITALFDKMVADNKPWDIGISYCMRSGRGTEHNSRKNIFHVLLEGELTPNKKKIADLVAAQLADSSYQIHAATETWKGSYGEQKSMRFETIRNALHSAVASGRIENVEYALSKGVKQWKHSSGYGSTAFADAVARDDDPAYHAIAMRLFENALTIPEGAEILSGPSRWDSNSITPLQKLAQKGDLPFTIAMAQANAGVPEMAVNMFTYTEAVTLGGGHSVAAGGDVISHDEIKTTRTKTEYQIAPTGKQEDPFPYIHQAVFNLDPKGGFYRAHQDIFGLAVKHLIEKGVLNEEQVPKPSLNDQRSLNFIFSIRAAAEAERARNPGFLAKTAEFTDGFTEEVRKASTLTNNFRVIYDAQHPNETSARAYDEEGLSTGQKVAVKGPLKLKKPAG